MNRVSRTLIKGDGTGIEDHKYDPCQSVISGPCCQSRFFGKLVVTISDNFYTTVFALAIQGRTQTGRWWFGARRMQRNKDVPVASYLATVKGFDAKLPPLSPSSSCKRPAITRTSYQGFPVFRLTNIPWASGRRGYSWSRWSIQMRLPSRLKQAGFA